MYHTGGLDRIYPGFFDSTWTSTLSQLWEPWWTSPHQGSGNHQIQARYEVPWCGTQDMGYLDMVPDHIGQQGPHHTSNEHRLQNYVLHIFLLIVLINFGCLSIQLPLMLVMHNRCAVDTSNVKGIGAIFHCFECECHKLEVLCHCDGNVVSPVQCLPTC